MNLNEIVQEVIDITSRPDREDFIRRKVRAAILECHQAARFPRDRIEEVFQLNEPATLVKLTLPPRWKRFEVLGAMTNNGQPIALTTKDNMFKRVEPDGLFSGEIEQTNDVYYVAGSVLNIRASVMIPNVYAVYRAAPEVADNFLETWLMAENSDLVTQKTLSKVQGTFGREKLAAQALNQFQMSMIDFIAEHIVEGDN